jgi:hypothetical protein
MHVSDGSEVGDRRYASAKMPLWRDAARSETSSSSFCACQRPSTGTSPPSTGTWGARCRTRRSMVATPMPASSPHTITARLRGAQCNSEWTSRVVTAVRESIVAEWARRSLARCCSVPPQSSTNSGCGGCARLIPCPLASNWSGRIHPCVWHCGLPAAGRCRRAGDDRVVQNGQTAEVTARSHRR